MENITLRSLLALSKLQKHHIQFVIMALTILVLVLGAGAPVDGGGIGH